MSGLLDGQQRKPKQARVGKATTANCRLIHHPNTTTQLTMQPSQIRAVRLVPLTSHAHILTTLQAGFGTKFEGHHGMQPWVSLPNYKAYQSKYGPK